MKLLDRFESVGGCIAWEGEILDPGELRHRVAAVASRLLTLPRGARVALHLGHGVHAPVWLLGCLAAGCVAVPLDRHLPPQRLAELVERSGASLLVTEGRRGDAVTKRIPVLREVLGELAPVERQATVRRDEDPEAPALILWTSGSTGAPKGVTVPRRAVDAFVEHWRERLSVGLEDRVAWTAALSFDLSLLDLGVALTSGARLVPVPERLLGFPTELADWLAEQEISLLYTVPSLLDRLEREGPPRSLRTVLSAGEALPAELARRLRSRVPTVANLFGPTETNVSTAWFVPEGWDGDVVPIGSPCPYVDVRLRDGELLVRGATVMTGYWGEPERARWDDGWLCTGDRARQEGDGFVFLGRADRMLKVSGYRVEPEEVERALLGQPGVRGAAVDARDGALIAWVEGEDLDAERLRAALRHSLPVWAVPERVTLLEELPRTPRGKVDRGALD